MKSIKNNLLCSINYLSSKLAFINIVLWHIFVVKKKCPKIFIIEPTNTCNGTCPLCPIGLKQTNRKSGFMDIKKYQILIDEISGFAKTIIFNFAGEPTMHPEIGKLIKYARSKKLDVFLGTNGTIKKSEEVIASDPSEILFALDGATKETYHKYRNFLGVEFEDVLLNLKDLVAEKKKQNKNTKIILQFVVMKDNEKEISEIIKLANDLCVDGIDLKPVSLMAADKIDQSEALKKYLPNSNIKQYNLKKGNVENSQPGYCSFAFSTAVILYNGDLSSCCYDFNGDQIFANVFQNGFRKAWRSEKAREYRERIFQKKLPLCRDCGITYKTIKRINLSK